MPSTGATERRYDNSRRAERAAATRRAVLEATRRVVVEKGYSGVTVRAIAQEAAVSLATVYRGFGSRHELVMQVLGEARIGDPDPSTVERPCGVEILTAAAARTRRVFDELGPAQAVLLVAARAGEAELRSAAAGSRARRLAEATRIVRAVIDVGDLRADVDQDSAVDVIWTLMSPEVHLQLTEDRGWSGEEYERWLATALITAVLAP